jgi:hypothetical protein
LIKQPRPKSQTEFTDESCLSAKGGPKADYGGTESTNIEVVNPPMEGSIINLKVCAFSVASGIPSPAAITLPAQVQQDREQAD